MKELRATQCCVTESNHHYPFFLNLEVAYLNRTSTLCPITSENKNMVLVLCFVLFQSSSQVLHWAYSKLMLLPKARATAKNGIWSITVLRRTGPLWLSLGLFHTTRFTPDFLITLFIQRGERSCHLEESDYSNKNYTQVLIDSIQPTKTQSYTSQTHSLLKTDVHF